MPTQILMPALSPTMEEGTLARWLVKVGDAVKSGDIMAEIETDKATMEFEAVDEGTIGAILVAEGTEGVKVNAPIATLLAEGEEAGAAPETVAPAAPSPGPGDAGTAQPAQTKGPADAAPASGVASDYTVGPMADRVAGGDPGLLDAAVPPITPSTSQQGGSQAATPAPAPQPAAPQPIAPAPAAGANGRTFASPLARRLAAERGIDVAAVTGSGPHGRVVRADVEGFEAPAQPPQAAPAQQPAAAPAPPPAAPAPAPTPAPVADAPKGPAADAVLRMYEGRAFEEIKLDGMRKVIAQRLTEAKQTIPHFYLRRDVRLDALLAFRAQLNGALEARKVKLSVNDFVIKACALALQQVPDANAVWAGDRVLRMKASDVAVAVAVEGGLFTPVIRDAEAKSLSALSTEMKDLAARAKARKLAPGEYQGGSFAVSNLGMFGIDSFDAVINPPHGAILAVGAGVERAVVDSGAVGVATVMTCTLSVDHRVIDGALGAQLLQAIKDNLENPLGMLA